MANVEEGITFDVEKNAQVNQLELEKSMINLKKNLNSDSPTQHSVCSQVTLVIKETLG